MKDMRVTNNTVKWQQHVSALYPKRPLQAEGNGCFEDRDLIV